jgi:hypothetical protein
VFYICCEGFYEIGRRIAAWHIAYGTKAADVTNHQPPTINTDRVPLAKRFENR